MKTVIIFKGNMKDFVNFAEYIKKYDSDITLLEYIKREDYLLQNGKST